MRTSSLRLCLAFLLMLTLTILPLPEIIMGIRPPWVLILALYVQFYLPDNFNLPVLFLLGLILDALLSTVMGEHAFALCFVTWIASSKARRFNFFAMGQQMALIGFFCLAYQLTLFFMDAFFGFYVSLFNALSSTLLSVLLWPWVRLLTEDTLLIRIHSR